MEKGLSSESAAVSNPRRNPFGEGMIRMENPFALKVGQVFTGFGIGCGVGIGHGRPINLGALPMVNQVLSATRGATDAFSGVTRQVNNALRKVGAKNIQVGVGCGIGFGHGFGVGIAVKPGVLQKIQACLLEAATTVAMKLGGVPNMSIVQGALPISLPGGIGVAGEPKIHRSATGITQLGGKFTDQTLQAIPGSRNDLANSSFARTENVLSSFLQNPLLNEDNPALKQTAGRLQSENSMLQMISILPLEFFRC
ncbi:hypothetical protein LINPERPRIM_LOCUS10089 [Linum perenne]